MEILIKFIDIFLHLDRYLDVVLRDFGLWTYAILFMIIFCETGLVVAPILPGDSLLFAAGAFAALGTLRLDGLLLVLSAAAILGDTLNYWIGSVLGPKVFQRENSRIFKREYLEKTQNFYEKYGAKTIVLARFVPIVRTFAPFVAGVGKMSYLKFLAYNAAGGTLWILVCVLAGYFFGNIPVVKENFSVVILAIIFVSILPGLAEFLRHMRARGRAAAP